MRAPDQFHAFKKRKFDQTTVDISPLQTRHKTFLSTKAADEYVEVKNADPFSDFSHMFNLEARKVCLDKERKELVYVDLIPASVDIVPLARFQSVSCSKIIRIYQHNDQSWMASEYIPVELPKILCWHPILNKTSWELVIHSLVNMLQDVHKELNLGLGLLKSDCIRVAECGAVKMDIYTVIQNARKFDSASTTRTDVKTLGRLLISIVDDHKPASTETRDRIPADLRKFVKECEAGNYELEEIRQHKVIVPREPSDYLGCLAHTALYMASWDIDSVVRNKENVV